MEFLKRSNRSQPKVSLVLLDWSVRESFHLLHYLSLQDVPRDWFEVVIVEYYSRTSNAIKKFEGQVDTWLKLDMPADCYYHKHLMYNAGIAVANGEIIIVCDSDAMVKPTFIRSIVDVFEQDPDVILHLDQFRNNRRDLYPFCYPSFEEVIGEGCINNTDDRPTGLSPTDDPIHERNYGACLCAKRSDLIAIGGADEHIDFVGHICGPYDFTFRLMNEGKKEIWHQTEFLYHTWHPGQAGVDNYLGPHDGRQMSTTSLEALASKRILPQVENQVIGELRIGKEFSESFFCNNFISKDNKFITRRFFLESPEAQEWANSTYSNIVYCGYRIVNQDHEFLAYPLISNDSSKPVFLRDSSFKGIQKQIDNQLSFRFFRFLFMLPLLSFVTACQRLKRRHARNGKSSKFFNVLMKPYRFIRRVLKRLSNITIDARQQFNLSVALRLNCRSVEGNPSVKNIVIFVNRKSVYFLSKHFIKANGSDSRVKINYVASAVDLDRLLEDYNDKENKLIFSQHCMSKYQHQLSDHIYSSNVYVV